MVGAVDSTRWREEEQKCLRELTAAGLNAHAMPGSGSGIRKGDVRTDNLLIEQKTTDKNSYSVRDAELDKAEIEAYQSGTRRGIMRITLGSGRAVYVIPADLMVEWFERMADERWIS